MDAFDEAITKHQVEWRLSHLRNQDYGLHNGKAYPWILPRENWEENLWSGINGQSANSLPKYLRENKVQKHLGVHNLRSSWVSCANLYFPFRATPGGLDLLAGFLREHVAPEIAKADLLELEYAEEGNLHPSKLLGEIGGGRGAGQTSPDFAVKVRDAQGREGLVLIENKFTEHSFYSCSARTTTDTSARLGNPAPARCRHIVTVLDDPATQCHQNAWGRRYWDHLLPIVDRDRMSSLMCCPAALAGYQLFRQQALAEGIATSGRYHFVVSAVALDARNDVIQKCLARTGLPDISKDWPTLFAGKARFTTFTHQDWVDWVREHADKDRWGSWLSYVKERYGY